MGMTIEQAERLLSNHLDGVTNYCERELTDKAIKVAIDTMCKYQRIQEQVELAESENHVVDTARMIMVSKIINGE